MRSILVSYQYEIYRTTVRENCSVPYYYDSIQRKKLYLRMSSVLLSTSILAFENQAKLYC
jgi:hypothetical protein